MHRKERKGLLKHYDFMLLDEMSLRAAFLLLLHVRFGFMNPYSVPQGKVVENTVVHIQTPKGGYLLTAIGMKKIRKFGVYFVIMFILES